jgi:hypothetical protein
METFMCLTNDELRERKSYPAIKNGINDWLKAIKLYFSIAKAKERLKN